jgi:hypothetical protein
LAVSDDLVGRLAIMLMLGLAAVGCGSERPTTDRSSITVKLPPAKPYTPAPAFSFKSEQK